MTVLDCLKPLTLNAVGNDDRMLRNKFVIVCKCPGDRDTVLTVKCLAPGTHRETNDRSLPGGGILAVGIDSHKKKKDDQVEPIMELLLFH